MAEQHSDTLEKSLSAGQWSLLDTMMQRLFALGTFFILARLLTPHDFGVIALIAIVPSFLEGMTTLDFDTSAVQKRDNVERYLDAIWTFNIVRQLMLFAIVFFSAPYVASFFHVGYATFAIRIGSLSFLAQNLTNIGQTYFFINLDFKKVFLRDLVLQVSYSVITIVLAFFLRSYWALFLGTLLSTLLMALSTYALHPYRPKLDFVFGKLKDLFSLSRWLLIQEMMNQSVRTAQNALIGKFTAPEQLGLFSKATSLAIAPTSPIISLINTVSFASYARVQESAAHISEGVNKTFDTLLALSLPYLFIILLAGNQIVHIVLGTGWIAMTPYLKILTLAATFNILFYTLSTPVLNATGKPGLKSALNVVYSISILTSLILLVPKWGITGAAYAVLTSEVLTACITFVAMLIAIRLDFVRIASSFLVTLLSCLAPLPIDYLLLKTPFFNSTPGYLLLIAVSGIVYLAFIALFGMVFRTGPYATLKLIVQSFLSNRIARNVLVFLKLTQEPVRPLV